MVHAVDANNGRFDSQVDMSDIYTAIGDEVWG